MISAVEKESFRGSWGCSDGIGIVEVIFVVVVLWLGLGILVVGEDN